MTRAERAAETHGKGYNCAQAVACAFADKTDLSEEQIFRAVEAMGLGGGNMAGTCGAVAGANLILGLIHSCGDLNAPESKGKTYKVSGAFQAAFAEQNGSIICRELKGVESGKALTPCPVCIRTAVEMLEKILG